MLYFESDNLHCHSLFPPNICVRISDTSSALSFINSLFFVLISSKNFFKRFSNSSSEASISYPSVTFLITIFMFSFLDSKNEYIKKKYRKNGYYFIKIKNRYYFMLCLLERNLRFRRRLRTFLEEPLHMQAHY
ncbi:hypothetical protein STIV2_E132 [Sulfolobus turreted icosahedral virus 2]|uniref:Uncharacterized protein n=1 Tax=Sulfolobus turreted icosahedral virus 2 TaxID=754004 RepID=D5IEX9_9VIRU|nr:hypothetical protein STIV2_E132 [Sulfolobus turreted icosahedral virus 2]ADF27776.1 hypothetical protein STIV2_E132 [Sulfolobus turreted icosahedral virus 2]